MSLSHGNASGFCWSGMQFTIAWWILAIFTTALQIRSIISDCQCICVSSESVVTSCCVFFFKQIAELNEIFDLCSFYIYMRIIILPLKKPLLPMVKSD